MPRTKNATHKDVSNHQTTGVPVHRQATIAVTTVNATAKDVSRLNRTRAVGKAKSSWYFWV